MNTQQARLGDSLISQGIITPDALAIALKEQKTTHKPLGEVLEEMGFVTNAQIIEALSRNLGAESIDLSHIAVDAQALALLPKSVAQRFTLFPVSLDGETRTLRIAAANPDDVVMHDHVAAQLARQQIRPLWLLASRADIIAAIDRFYGHELSIEGILGELETGRIDAASVVASQGSYTHPIVRLADALLSDAVRRGASDIHFEPEESFLRVRFRIDGVLRQVRALHLAHWPALVVRLKVMAGMDIAESRAPQDGRISLTVAGRMVDFRCAVHPTLWGENFVLRILDKKRSIVSLDGLGLTEQQLALLKTLLARPEGILLVTGPTGSGKTTTLYSILNHLNRESVNIMTLEDPVEYPLSWVRQTQVGEAAKIDFSYGVRSLMRQDPDIILVGEIRDHDTAEMAFRAAMTGHQVFSTLHTNSAIRSIPRLFDLGIHPDVIAGNVIGIIAQRLVRKLCPACRRMEPPSAAERELLGIDASHLLGRPVGCPACDHQGYRGRTTIIEILAFDEELDELVAERASLRRLGEYAKSRGFAPMESDGLRRVREGITTLEEVARVVDLTRHGHAV